VEKETHDESEERVAVDLVAGTEELVQLLGGLDTYRKER
jgi:hypothetical protein